MSGLILHGAENPTSGLTVRNWRDDPALRLSIGPGGDGHSVSGRWVHGIVLHTTKGIPGGKDHRPQVVRPGLGSSGHGVRTANYWSTSAIQAGAHLIVDHDGSVSQCADLITEVAYHAGAVNGVSVGIEMFQGNDAELYEGQLAATVVLIDHLTRLLGIQRQFCWPYRNAPVYRIAAGGHDFVGVYGHRDVTSNRGLGDPGDAIFDRLRTAGYEAVDVSRGDDLDLWRARQRSLNVAGAGPVAEDGVPGIGTIAALRKANSSTGLWVQRPSDIP